MASKAEETSSTPAQGFNGIQTHDFHGTCPTNLAMKPHWKEVKSGFNFIFPKLDQSLLSLV